NDSSRAIDSAVVVITRGPDRLIEQDTTDANGAYSLKFDPGTGDYLVFVRASGYASARRRVQRAATEHELVANFTLKPGLATLAAVNVRATKPVRATNDIHPYNPETGASEKWNDGVKGELPPTIAGDLNAIAGTMSNVTMNGGTPSILGSGAESNLTTLNGMGMAAGAIPRAANTATRVTGATFDPTRGGFTGANIDVQLSPGNRLYQERRGFFTISPSALQFTDAVGRAAGAQTSNIRGSLGADGELIRNALTYNVAVDLAHSVSQPATLLDAGSDVFLRAGVAPDSVSRLTAIANPLGLALAGNGVASSRQHDAFSWLGRVDDTRDTLATRALTSYATYTRDGGLGFAPLSAPSAGGENRQQTLGAQLTLGNYVGVGRRILTETRLAASTTRTHATPYEQLPRANVLILSPADGGGTNASDVTLGGGLFSTDDSRWTLEGSNQTTWNTNGRRNHFKGLLWARADGLRQSGISNPFGSYSFNSLSDFAAGNADRYSRTLSQPNRSGTVWNAAAAIAHQWSPSRVFSVLYGARLEADGFAAAPARNAALATALGVNTNVAPSRFHLSPRAGFSYTYSKEKDNGIGMSNSQIGSFYRAMTGVIRGGIGEFRDLLRPDILANVSAATGLPGGTSQLSCVGAAVPSPGWAMFTSDPSTIPTRCLDDSGLLTDYSPAVSLISPSYDVPHSWRASLGWTSNISSWLLKVSALGSYDLSQPSSVNVNFTGAPRFTLGSEGDRPVYVSTAAIDASSGTVSSVEVRKAPAFGPVMMRTSDLRGYGGQLTTTISPDVFKFRFHSGFSLYTSLSYTLQDSRRQYRGFDGAAFGDPRLSEWAASNLDARHVLVYSLGVYTPKTGAMTLFARAQSGLPFTPIVQGDVNGDGIGGDRAFIPIPSLETDTALAGQLRSLIATGSSSARKCLLDNLGRAAPRNGCRGPWTGLLNAQWQPPLPRRWMGRVTPNIYFENVLGGVDQLLHGSNGLRGWGSPPVLDPVLLVPHGFDPTAKRFDYTINSRFADTRAVNTLTRNPFRITLDFSINLSVAYPLQQLRRAVEQVRGPNGWTRRSADSLAAFYLSRTSDIYKGLLQNSDSLFLTRPQIAMLQYDDSIYSAQVRAVYIPLGQFLAGRSASDPGKAEMDSAKNTQKAYLKAFWRQPEIADSAITPAQRELMPLLKSMLAVPSKDREHSQYNFGNPVTFADKPKPATH
ncbi:MAG: carboxypeptidase-like regulatory domain-containing protein, partial [Gemmatimonadaceae bacterium]